MEDFLDGTTSTGEADLTSPTPEPAATSPVASDKHPAEPADPGAPLISPDDHRTRIGDRLAGLHLVENEPIDLNLFSGRARSTLLRLRCFTWGSLAALHVADLLNARNVGPTVAGQVLGVAEDLHRSILARTGLPTSELDRFAQLAPLEGLAPIGDPQRLAPPDQHESFAEPPVDSWLNLRSARIGELLPALHAVADQPIAMDRLDVRSAHALEYIDCRTWGQLTEIRVGTLWDIPSTGELTVRRILTAAATAASAAAAQLPTGARVLSPLPSAPQLVRIVVPEHPESRRAFDTLWEELAEWARQTRGATTVAEALTALQGPTPPDITELSQRVLNTPLAEVHLAPTVGAHEAPADEVHTPTNPIDDYLTQLGGAARFVVPRQITNPEVAQPSLDALAKPAGITRERVRQLVARVGSDTRRELLARPEFRLLRWRAFDLARTLGRLAPDGEAFEAAVTAATDGMPDGDACSARDFMLWLAGRYRLRDGWWVREGERLEVVTAQMRTSLADHWLLDHGALIDRLRSLDITWSVTAEQIEALTRWRNIGRGWWVRWDGTIGDKAERVLRLALRPLDAHEMNRFIGEGHSATSVQNVMATDPRFTRVSMRQDYVLAEWGWEEYSGTASAITDHIERAVGRARLVDLARNIAERFGVKESTVRAYAATPAFVIEDGYVRLRRADEPVEVNDDLSTVDAVTRIDSSRLTYRATVDHDMLRGSGRSLPNPLAVHLGVRPGGERRFATASGEAIWVTWSMTSTVGATSGSLRAIVDPLGATEGDDLEMVFDVWSGTVSASLVNRARPGLT